MFRVLQRLFGEEALPLHLDVEGGRDVRHQDVDELADPEHDVFKDDDEGELEGEDLPVDRGQGAAVIPEPAVVALLLNNNFIQNKLFLET